MNAVRLYEAALAEPASALLARDRTGAARALPLTTWLDGPTDVDRRVLVRATGPVLDVGCGPGRHVHALAQLGVMALGVDISPHAVALARARGARAVHASIFDTIPGAGTWRTALLLDGNLGIGGCPAVLLRRVRELLAPDGRILCELEPPGSGVHREHLRLEHAAAASGWFAWARVGADAVDQPARGAGLCVHDRWCDEGRWFSELR